GGWLVSGPARRPVGAVDVSDGCLAAGDLHPPPGRPVLQDGELVYARAQFANLPPDRVQAGASEQFDLLATAHPQQPVHGRADRLLRGERVQVDHGPCGEQVPLVRVTTQGHGRWHALRPAAGCELVFLAAQVALEAGDEVADDV